METTKTLPEVKDIICNEMRDMYGRSEGGEDDIREVLRLERATEMQCERRETDARNIIRSEDLDGCVGGHVSLKQEYRKDQQQSSLIPTPVLLKTSTQRCLSRFAGISTLPRLSLSAVVALVVLLYDSLPQKTRSTEATCGV